MLNDFQAKFTILKSLQHVNAKERDGSQGVKTRWNSKGRGIEGRERANR